MKEFLLVLCCPCEPHVFSAFSLPSFSRKLGIDSVQCGEILLKWVTKLTGDELL